MLETEKDLKQKAILKQIQKKFANKAFDLKLKHLISWGLDVTHKPHKYIDNSIINLNLQFYTELEFFANNLGYKVRYNNTRSVIWVEEI